MEVYINIKMENIISEFLEKPIDIQGLIKKNNIEESLHKKETCLRKYKIKHLHTESKQTFWYTKKFNLKYNLFWRKTPWKLKDEKLSEYEWEGNELFFFEGNEVGNNLKKAIGIFLFMISQLNKYKGHKFHIALIVSDMEDENYVYRCGVVSIRFYEVRNEVSFIEKSQKYDPMILCEIN